MLFHLHPQTGILILKKTVNYPTSSYTPDQITEMTLFNGLVILNDKTGSSKVISDDSGVLRFEEYVIQIDKDELDATGIEINKHDIQFLEVLINPYQFRKDTLYLASDNDLILKVIDIVHPNGVVLNHIKLICELPK